MNLLREVSWDSLKPLFFQADASFRRRPFSTSGCDYSHLEGRQLLTSVFIENGVLNIFGTDSVDRVVVAPVNDATVRVNATTAGVQDLSRSQFNEILFIGVGGDDFFDNRTNIPSRAFGNNGNDTLIGGTADDVLVGGGGSDRIQGDSGDDTIRGGGGGSTPNILSGGAGDDRIFGGVGENTINGDAGDDVVFGSSSADEVDGGDGDDQLYVGDGANIVRGGSGDDLVIGGAGLDTVFGEAGLDRIYSLGGNDVLEGGDGIDILFGGDGDDRHIGGSGDDVIRTGRGDDFADGGVGDDVIVGFQGNNTLNGGAGDDRINAGSGNDTVNGGDGADKLFGLAGNDIINGGAGNDFISGEVGIDTISGDAGEDSILGGDGDDVINGGTENDFVAGNAGNDTIEGGLGDDSLVGGAGDDRIRGGSGADGLFGNAGHDFLEGGNGNDRIVGHEGNDQLFGGNNRDQLFGGTGLDGLSGGSGTDTLRGESGADRFLSLSGDSRPDFNDADALIEFRSGDLSWTHREVEVVDEGLRRLHIRTGGTRVLRDTLDSTPLQFVKQSGAGNAGEAGINRLSNSFTFDSTGQILSETFTRRIELNDWDENDQRANQFRIDTTIHEIAHNWDSAREINEVFAGQGRIWDRYIAVNGWRTSAASGFTRSAVATSEPFDLEFDAATTSFNQVQTTWYYRDGAVFSREYGRTNAQEDWATVWEVALSDDPEDRVGLTAQIAEVNRLFNLL